MLTIHQSSAASSKTLFHPYYVDHTPIIRRQFQYTVSSLLCLPYTTHPPPVPRHCFILIMFTIHHSSAASSKTRFHPYYVYHTPLIRRQFQDTVSSLLCLPYTTHPPPVPRHGFILIMFTIHHSSAASSNTLFHPYYVYHTPLIRRQYQDNVSSLLCLPYTTHPPPVPRDGFILIMFTIHH